MVKHMSDLGMGKQEAMDSVIWQDARQVLQRVAQNDGRPFEARGMFLPATNNVIWHLATGERRRQDDPMIIDLTKKLERNFQTLSPNDPISLLMINSLTFTKLIRFLGFNNMISSGQAVYDMVKLAIDKSSANADGNYIERGLAKIDEKLNSKTFGSYNGRAYLATQLADMFAAGTDTTSALSEWCLAYLLNFPEWQEKIFAEISMLTNDNERSIHLNDRSDAHFTNAFIEEVSRLTPMVIFPPPRKTLLDATLEDKLIPKGTQVMYSLYAVNRDEAMFPDKDAHDFIPERFLEEGVFKRELAFVNIFGVGKRRCPGELLARAEVFIYVASLVQCLKLKPGISGKPILDDGISGLVMCVKPFDFIPEKRPNINLL